MADAKLLQALFADRDAPRYAEYFRRGWVVQRIGWAALLALTAAGAAGLFGSGPASSARASFPGAAVDYERFLRLDRESELSFRLDGAGSTELWFDADYAARLKLEAVSPQPRRARSADGRLTFEFDLSGPSIVTFHARPRRAGALVGEAGLMGGGAARLRQFVYP